MNTYTGTFEFFSYYASALINGDYSGLEDEEVKELDAFLDSIDGYVSREYGIDATWSVVDVSEQTWFSHNVCDGIGGDCSTYIIIVRTNEVTS